MISKHFQAKTIEVHVNNLAIIYLFVYLVWLPAMEWHIQMRVVISLTRVGLAELLLKYGWLDFMVVLVCVIRPLPNCLRSGAFSIDVCCYLRLLWYVMGYLLRCIWRPPAVKSFVKPVSCDFLYFVSLPVISIAKLLETYDFMCVCVWGDNSPAIANWTRNFYFWWDVIPFSKPYWPPIM